MTLNRRHTVSLCSALALLLSPGVANAQEIEVSEAHTTGDSTISPRFGVDFNSPRSGDDERSYGRATGFIPLGQTPGHGLTFLDTAVRINSTGDLGGTVTLGQRFLRGNLVLGGHLSYDIRDTGSNTFNQLGLGLEAFGDKWDMHLNGYLPVGDTQQSAGSTSSTGLASGTQFQGNQLVVVTAGGSEFLESAWGGIDFDAGMQLTDWEDWGQLWGYGGVYYHGDAIGGRLRLDHRVQDWLRLGLGVQSDDNFGTRGFFSVGFSWGGGANSSSSEDSTVWARAAESVTRNSSIVVKESEVVTVGGTEIAINPTTGQAYSFQHVVPEAGATGDGTVESPYANATLVNAQAGDVVYVAVGDSRTNPLTPFTVPAGVTLISTALAETVTTQFGEIALPGSGTGILPLVDAMGSNVGITLTGGNNRLSGFEITGAIDANLLIDNSNNALVENNFSRDALDDGIEVTNSSNVTLTNNIFSNSGDDAIDLENSANAVISDNTISGSTVDGIDILNSAGLMINNNTISDSGGIGIALEESSDAVIQNNIITNSVEAGIGLFASANTTVDDNSIDGGDFGILAVESDNAVIQNNTIANIALSGIEVADSNNAAVTGNTISNSDEFGIFIDTADGTLVQNNQITDSVLAGIELTSANNARLIGNTISDSGSGGIFVIDSETITIQDNQVTGTATDLTNDGIVGAIFLQEVVGTVDISGNTVTGTTGTNELDGQGITIGNSTGDIALTIDDNDVNNNQGDGIGIALIDVFTTGPGDATADITITNNRIENNGVAVSLRGDGIRIAVEEDSVINSLLIEDNTLTGNFDDGIDISAGLAQLLTVIVPDPNISSSNAQVLNAVIRNNEVTNSLNGEGILLRSFGDNSNIVVSVEGNTLTNNALGGLEAISTDTNGAPETRLCLALNNNTSDGDYTLFETLPLLLITSSNFTVVNRDGVNGANTGTVIFNPGIGSFDTVASIAACP